MATKHRLEYVVQYAKPDGRWLDDGTFLDVIPAARRVIVLNDSYEGRIPYRLICRKTTIEETVMSAERETKPW